MMKSLLYVGMLLLLSLPGFSQNTYTLSLPERGELDIDVYDASVQVNGIEGTSAMVTFLKEGARKPASSRELPHYDVRWEDDKLRIFKKKSHRIKGILIQIDIPKHFSCRVKTHFGKKVEIQDVVGDVVVDAYFGEVNIQDCHGRIEVNSFEGLVTLKELSNSAIVHNTEGDIQASFQQLPPGFTSIFSSNKGHIQIKLESNVKLLIALDTYFGKIDSQFQLGIPDAKAFPQLPARSSFSYRTINRGANDVRLTVKNYFGNIELLKTKHAE